MDKMTADSIKKKETRRETVRLSLTIPVLACTELFVVAVFSVPLVLDEN